MNGAIGIWYKMKPLFTTFRKKDKKNLLETGNMGRVVELKGRNGEYIPSFISLDKMTNEVVAMRCLLYTSNGRLHGNMKPRARK